MEFSGTTNRVTFLRGDDDALLVTLAAGASFSDGDKVFFSLKATAEDDVDLLQIESTEFVAVEIDGVDVENAGCLVTITHTDTIDLDHGKYFYDVLIQWADSTYQTIIPPTRFELEPGGSHDVP